MKKEECKYTQQIKQGQSKIKMEQRKLVGSARVKKGLGPRNQGQPTP